MRIATLLIRKNLGLICVPAVSALALHAADAEWPRFRGPNGSGVPVVEETAIPIEFGPTKNVVWKTPLPIGHSSPVFTANSIFLTGFEDEKLLTFCLDRETGTIRWRREVVRERKGDLYGPNNPAVASPVTDGENVYVFFQDLGLLSYGPDGNERWRLPLGPFNNPMGLGTSPILAGGNIVVVCDTETDAFIVSVGKDTGEIAWRKDRDVTRGYTTPIVYDPPDGSGPQVLVSGSYRLVSYSAATGEEVWWVRGLTWSLKATPVLDKDTVYVVGWSGFADLGEQQDVPPFEEVLPGNDKDGDGQLSRDELPDPKMKSIWNDLDLDHDGRLNPRDWLHYQRKRESVNAMDAIRLGGKGDRTEGAFRWRYYKSLPNIPSPVLYEGIVYMVKDGGIVTALDAQSGEVLKQGRLREAMDRYFTSPVAAGGYIFMISETGKVSVLKPGADWEVIQVNDMDEEVHATPAILDGKIYLRTAGSLYCFGQ